MRIKLEIDMRNYAYACIMERILERRAFESDLAPKYMTDEQAQDWTDRNYDVWEILLTVIDFENHPEYKHN